MIGQIEKSFKQAALATKETFSNLGNDVKALFPQPAAPTESKEEKRVGGTQGDPAGQLLRHQCGL